MNKLKKNVSHALCLDALTATDLMTPNPVSISENATTKEAGAVLTAREISAAAVINEAGRPLGVLSRADLVRHERNGFIPSMVRDTMTKAVITVDQEVPAWEAVAKMTALKVHRLFVVDKESVLIGVISAFDVVRKLRQQRSPG
jgi:CBS domain-containing protein